MDYEEFNKEYKYFTEWWRNDEEPSPQTDELVWGRDVAMNKKAKQFKQLESKHAKNDRWLQIDQWTGQEDNPAKNDIKLTSLVTEDRVNSPSHYTSGRMESIDIIEDAIAVAPTPQSGFLQGQVLKYMLRVWLKDNPLEDLKKARWYLDRLIKSLE